jgi:hypothetical protein
VAPQSPAPLPTTAPSRSEAPSRLTPTTPTQPTKNATATGRW